VHNAWHLFAWHLFAKKPTCDKIDDALKQRPGEKIRDAVEDAKK
jgi:hypothetical protein